MPSTLYESVKKSVIEFAELRKKNEKLQDKLVFKWKLITLGLSIVFIILIGGFSQILKAVNSLPDKKSDKTFILPLLQAVSTNSVPTIQQANLLVDGVTSSLDKADSHFEWNRVNSLFDPQNVTGQLDINNITNAILNKENLVWIISSPGPNAPNKFGFFTKQIYKENGGVANISDEAETRFSTFFNLDSAEVLNYDAPNCPIIVKDATQLILFSSLRITNSGSDVSLLNDRFDCFKGADINAAIDTLNKLTNLDVTATTPAPITIYNIQIFQLYLDQSL